MTTSYCLRRDLVDRVAGDLDRVADTVAGLGREDRYAGPLADDLQLVDGVRALEVGRDQQRLLPCSLSHRASLPASVVLPAPWRPASMITVGGFFANRSRRVSPPRIVDELVVDDLDDLLGRVQRLADLVAAGALLDRIDELLDDRQGDVGLEQGDPDLAHGGVDVRLGEPALAAEVLEGRRRGGRRGWRTSQSSKQVGFVRDSSLTGGPTPARLPAVRALVGPRGG